MPFPANDGGAIASLNMITGFAALGNEVTVLAMQTPKHNFTVDQLPDHLLNQIRWHQVKVNTAINPVKAIWNILFSNKPYNAVRFQSKRFSRKLTYLLSGNEYDIIQIEGLYLTPYLPVIRRKSKSLVSLRAHNVEWEIWERLAANEKNEIKKSYLNLLAQRIKRMEYLALKKIDLLVPITFRDSSMLPFHDDSKIMVSPTGIEEAKFADRPAKTEEKSFFHIGALDWIPNQEALLWFIKNIWLSIKANHPEYEFIVAGRNASKNFEAQLKQYPVIYAGEVDDAVRFIDSHQVMVVPLLSGSGLRIKIIEGMARGKCIMTTPMGAEGISAINGEQLLIGKTPEVWIEMIEHLILDTTRIQEIGIKALQFVKENFNNQQIISQLNDFYIKQLN